ncbi:serine acetyltransferase [Zobellia sp. OII3]|uniref:serine acetyltransferase n=1 Tax=Zobellia sp. OII3 TaxID=2034520 RepID=UPI000B52DEF6|nr:serine acetyltransferase [Zobellia sp. OII3]OWW26241.1 serine acetyltransferase [Zobellia sp. OII3]
MMSYLFQDWKSNKRNIKAQLIMLGFRLANLATRNRIVFILFIPYLVFYRITVEWFLGVELPYKTRIGRGLKIFHGQALVVNDGTIIGENCTLRNSTTIGNKILSNGELSRSPIIGNNVEIGCNVCIIGDIKIGDNVKIGAGSVVVKDVASNSIIGGNPAKELRISRE